MKEKNFTTDAQKWGSKLGATFSATQISERNLAKKLDRLRNENILFLSKSSASGSSGFECFNQSVGVGIGIGVSDKTIKVGCSVTIPVTSGVSSPQTTTISVNQSSSCYKKSHKKTKKSIERSRSGTKSFTHSYKRVMLTTRRKLVFEIKLINDA